MTNTAHLATDLDLNEMQVLDFTLRQALHSVDSSKLFISGMPRTPIHGLAEDAINAAHLALHAAQARINHALTAAAATA